MMNKVKSKKNGSPFEIVILYADDIIELLAELEKVLDVAVSNYKKRILDEDMKRFISMNTIDYKGNQYELMDRFNSEHEEISLLFYWWRLTKGFVAEERSLHFCFWSGITYRDDSILRFLYYVSKGKSTIVDIQNHYSATLSPGEIAASVSYLASLNCITVENESVSLTQTGRNII